MSAPLTPTPAEQGTPSVQPVKKRQFLVEVQEWRSHTIEIEAVDEDEACDLADELFSEEGEDAFDCFNSAVSDIIATEVHDD